MTDLYSAEIGRKLICLRIVPRAYAAAETDSVSGKNRRAEPILDFRFEYRSEDLDELYE
ncbi:hypothetical protein RTCIAT899_PC01645 (plasmid) [Rhizobium tropici CIAT 899]|nr:hypothetical protein RTCIAT899_PC01645 [Rhizobium tropici CIAT 899]